MQHLEYLFIQQLLSVKCLSGKIKYNSKQKQRRAVLHEACTLRGRRTLIN